MSTISYTVLRSRAVKNEIVISDDAKQKKEENVGPATAALVLIYQLSECPTITISIWYRRRCVLGLEISAFFSVFYSGSSQTGDGRGTQH